MCPWGELCHLGAYSWGVGLCQPAVFLPSCSAEIRSDDGLAFCYILGIWLEAHVSLQNHAGLLRLHTSRVWEDATGLQLCLMQWLHRSQQLPCWWLAFTDYMLLSRQAGRKKFTLCFLFVMSNCLCHGVCWNQSLMLVQKLLQKKFELAALEMVSVSQSKEAIRFSCSVEWNLGSVYFSLFYHANTDWSCNCCLGMF